MPFGPFKASLLAGLGASLCDRALLAALHAAPRAAARLGHAVTIPRANGFVLLAGGTRSRFSLTFSLPLDSPTGRYAVAPAGALLTGLVAALGPGSRRQRIGGAMLTLLRVHFRFPAF